MIKTQLQTYCKSYSFWECKLCFYKISDQGYTILYLTNRAIGQSDMTRNYLESLRESGYKMPEGPILLQVDSVLGAFETEVSS